MSQTFPVAGAPVNEAGQVIIDVSFPSTCPARTRPLTVCIDLWDTTACPPGAPVNSCDGNIRGSTGFMPSGGWVRDRGPTVCNRRFLEDIGGTIQHQLNFTFSVQDDSVKADRQNYLIVHTHNPYQVLRIPIVDND